MFFLFVKIYLVNLDVIIMSKKQKITAGGRRNGVGNLNNYNKQRSMANISTPTQKGSSLSPSS